MKLIETVIDKWGIQSDILQGISFDNWYAGKQEHIGKGRAK